MCGVQSFDAHPDRKQTKALIRMCIICVITQSRNQLIKRAMPQIRTWWPHFQNQNAHHISMSFLLPLLHVNYHLPRLRLIHTTSPRMQSCSRVRPTCSNEGKPFVFRYLYNFRTLQHITDSTNHLHNQSRTSRI